MHNEVLKDKFGTNDLAKLAKLQSLGFMANNRNSQLYLQKLQTPQNAPMFST